MKIRGKVKNRYGLLFLFAVVSCLSLFSACAPAEPILPAETAEKITANIGYALAPTWLPEGFEYSPPTTGNLASERLFTGDMAMVNYRRIVSMQQVDNLLIAYPSSDTYPASFQKLFDLTPPEGAISEVTVNGKTALLYHGRWSDETLKRIQHLETPLDPEWDYEASLSIRFPFDVPGEGEIWVDISTVFPPVELTEKDLTRIAGSVVAVEE